jgi:hypothetical protein
MLTWQGNAPRFVAEGIVGDKMTFFFGLTNLDDIEIAEFHFVIQLFECNGTWSVHTEWRQWGDQDQKPKVEVFLSELNTALKTRQGFDFKKYWQDWSHKDSHFAVVLGTALGGCQRVY